MSNTIIKNIIITLAAYVMTFFSLNAADISAEKSYADGDYDSAIRQWEQMRSDGVLSSQLYYDLANAYYKSGDNGAAVLNYLKALRIDPSNSEARDNLRYVLAQVQIVNETLTDGKNIDPTPADPDIVDGLVNNISKWGSNTWAVIAVCLFFLALLCAGGYIFMSNVRIRKVGFFGGIAVLVLSAVAIYFSVLSKRQALSEDTYVLMAGNSSLLKQPEAESETVAAPLAPGTILRVIDTKTDAMGNSWTCVFLNTDYGGWLPSTSLARVEVTNMGE